MKHFKNILLLIIIASNLLILLAIMTVLLIAIIIASFPAVLCCILEAFRRHINLPKQQTWTITSSLNKFWEHLFDAPPTEDVELDIEEE